MSRTRLHVSRFLLLCVGLCTQIFLRAQPPPRPRHDIWIEGEDCADHDFTTVGRDPVFRRHCYGQAILQLQTHADAPPGGYRATFTARIPTPGWWRILLAVTRVDTGRLSPYSLQVGGYAARNLAGLTADSPYGAGKIFCWLDAGAFELPAGKVPLTIRCRERRPEVEDYLVYVDAIALRRVPAPVSDLRWIAGPEGTPEWVFEAPFSLGDEVRDPVLSVVCDGRFTVRLDGVTMGDGAGWERARRIRLGEALAGGAHALRVSVEPGKPGGLLAWLTVAGNRGTNPVILGTGPAWRCLRGRKRRTPARMLGGPRMKPWGDMTVQPPLRLPLTGLRIPIKTGNLSVNLLTAVARGMKRPRPAPLPHLERYRDYGGVSLMEDYLCWLPLEPKRGDYRWEFYENNCAELEKKGMKYAVYPWLHFPPKWAVDSELWTPLRCLSHGKSTWAPSIWAPATRKIFERFYDALRDRMGDRVKEIYLSLICDYGEVGYPVGMANWVVRSEHVHPDFWCGDRWARQAFRADTRRKYARLTDLNAAWGTLFDSPADIDFPPWTSTQGPEYAEVASLPPEQRAQVRRRWLDFCEWYLAAMGSFTADAVAVVRRRYPDTPIEIKIGHGAEPVRYGVDPTACLARSRELGFSVRSTHGTLSPYFYRRFSTAAKHYGVPLITEPPSNASRNAEVERIFKDATSGTTEFFDYPDNLLAATDLFRRYGPYMEGEHSLTDVAFFVPTTDHRLRPGQGNPEALLAACGASRDLFDWDLVDERLVRAGALDRYRTLILAEGNVVEADVLARIGEWVHAGGRLLSADFGPVETVEGDRSWDESMFVARTTIPPAEEIWRLQGNPKDARLLDLNALRKGCIRTVGDGATILAPLDRQRMKTLAALASLLVHAPGDLLPGERSFGHLDGVADGVWTALLPTRVLFYNGSDEERRPFVRLRPDALSRAGAAAPARETEITVELPPRSLGSIELPGCRVSVP